MEYPSAYISSDRRLAMAQNQELPTRTVGTGLFADISGFTPLTEALAQALGPQRGAEELTHHLDLVYDALIGQVMRYGGSVIGFSGDAITCWFDRDNGQRATAAALAMQRDMAQFAAIQMPDGKTISLALKTGIAAGPVLRFIVGEPNIQLIDVIAGIAIDRAVQAEHHAKQGEVILDEQSCAFICNHTKIDKVYRDDENAPKFAVVTELLTTVDPSPLPELAADALTEDQVRPWILRPIYERLVRKGTFLAELRPVVPLFLRFGGIDYADAESAVPKLDAYIRWVQNVIAKYDGTLLQLTIGDKGSYLYAVFGALVAHRDDTIRAIAAAQELREPPPALRFIHSTQIGISRGRMRAGPYGSRMRRTYGTLGDEVNVAARLMQSAAPGQILVTRAVAEGVGQAFSFVELEPLRLKGKTEPILVSTLAAQAQNEIRLQEPTHDLPMVGRQAELRSIAEKLELAAEGKGQIVGISAEAGMGKSRLIAEVIKSAKTKGFVGFSGACQSFGTSATYLVWHEIWENFFGLDTTASDSEQIKRLESALNQYDPSFAQRLPLLSNVVGLTIPDNSLTLSLDSQLRKTSLEALLVACVKARAAQSKTPLLFVLEDCHWIDPLSEDLLSALAHSIPHERILILLAYRPLEPTATQTLAMMNLPHASVIPLRDFTPAEAQRLIELKLAQFGDVMGSITPDFVERITARAEGNPFYIEELLNFLRDQQDVMHDKRVLEAAGLPDSLHSLILSRIDRLSDSQKITIKVASVIGRSFGFRWLWGTYPDLGSTEDVRTDLAQLNRLDLTPLDIPEPELRYLFKHAVTQQVAYESQPYAARSQMHGNLGGYIERTYADNLDKFLDLLAYHYGRSSDTAKQREYFRRAGMAAEAAYAPETAIAYYQSALAIWPPPQDVNEAILRLEVFEHLGKMLINRARYGEARGNFRTMIEQSHQAGLPTVESRAWCGLSRAQSTAGDQQSALESATQAENLARQADATLELAAALEMKGRCVFRLGDSNAALALGEQMLELASEHNARLQMSQSLNLIGASHHVLGHYAEAQSAWERAFEIARGLNDRRQMMSLLNNLGVNSQGRGDYHQALLRYQTALETAQEIGHRDGEIMFLGNVGEARVHLGEFERAETELRQILEADMSQNACNLAATPLAEALLGQNRLSEALEAARQALAMQQRSDDQTLLAATWRVLGQVAARLNRPILVQKTEDSPAVAFTATECFAESIRICQELEMEGERARTLREWANYEISNENYQAGVVKWLTARDLFAKLGADFEVARMQVTPQPVPSNEKA